MTNYKEIITKAVIGKHKKVTNDNFIIEVDEKPNTVLGCWVINHSFKGNKSSNNILINGSYDVNVWYSYDNDHKTKVNTKTFNYNDTLNVSNNYDNSSEIIVNCLKQPTVVDVGIKDGKIDLKIEKDMGVEIIGSTTVKVATEDDISEYEEIYDEQLDKEIDINIDNLEENYLDNNSQ